MPAQYQVLVDPARLRHYKPERASGGASRGGQQCQCQRRHPAAGDRAVSDSRGVGMIRTLDDIGTIALASREEC